MQNDADPRHRAQMKEFKGQVLEKNKESYRQRQALEMVKEALADLPVEFQQQVLDQLEEQVEEGKRTRDPLEDEIFGRSDEDAEEKVPEDREPKAAKRRKGENQRSTDIEDAGERKEQEAVGKPQKAAKERKEGRHKIKGKHPAETEEPRPMKNKKSLGDKAPEAARERKEERQKSTGKDSAETEEPKPMKKKQPLEDTALETAKERKEEAAETKKEQSLKRKKLPEDKAPEAARERKEERQKSKGRDSAETEEQKCAKKVEEREARTSQARERQTESDVNTVSRFKELAMEAGEDKATKKFKVSDLQYGPPNPTATFKKLRPGPAEVVEL